MDPGPRGAVRLQVLRPNGSSLVPDAGAASPPERLLGILVSIRDAGLGGAMGIVESNVLPSVIVPEGIQ